MDNQSELTIITIIKCHYQHYTPILLKKRKELNKNKEFKLNRHNVIIRELIKKQCKNENK